MQAIFNTLDKKMDDELSNLRWVRIFDPIHIPEKYIERIKDRSFSVEKFYKMQQRACIHEIDGKMILNPFNLLFVLVNEDCVTKGFCWMVVDQLSNSLVINTFSMDEEYWGAGKCVRLLEKKAIEIKDGAELDKIYWVTRCPKHSKKYGFKESKNVLMEYTGYGRNNNGQSGEAGGASELDESPADEVPELNSV